VQTPQCVVIGINTDTINVVQAIAAGNAKSVTVCTSLTSAATATATATATAIAVATVIVVVVVVVVVVVGGGAAAYGCNGVRSAPERGDASCILLRVKETCTDRQFVLHAKKQQNGCNGVRSAPERGYASCILYKRSCKNEVTMVCEYGFA
jgi:hypothetical protein